MFVAINFSSKVLWFYIIKSDAFLAGNSDLQRL